MKRTGFARKPKPGVCSTFKPKRDHRGKPLAWSSFKTPESGAASSLTRSRMHSKPRRPKPGDDARYKAFVRSQPCCVGPRFGRCRGRLDPHHMTEGRGEQRRGKGQTARDRDAIPLCRRHHDEFQQHVGFSKGWTRDERRTWQEQEIERLNKIYDEHESLGVWQEPIREMA